MLVDSFEIKSGIKVHLIQNDIFKTNIACVLLTTPLLKDTVTRKCITSIFIKKWNKKIHYTSWDK